ncbi:MAG: OprD family outer membrane porin [Ferruginibacter sp.]|nr:outer membrane porin, OprD family [Ferruginibacter sp.]
MNYLKQLFIILFIVCGLNSFAQHQEISDKPDTWKGKNQVVNNDTTSLLQAFKKGHLSGHFRYFFMATENKKNLTDYYANAIGGGIKFETAKFHHFQFGVSGFYIFNIGSSNLANLDAITNQKNRYEIALFDIENPNNKKNIDRLEELYLKYNFKKSHITLGKQLINTPFINLQDGRMRPTEVEGVWAEINEIKNTKIEGGFLYKVSPRSTLEFYNIGESIGIYSSGVNVDGAKSNYANNLESKGIVSFGVSNKSIKNLSLQLWNQYVENIFNTSMLQADYKKTFPNKTTINAGLQSIFQTAINNGGNEDASKTYINKNAKSFTIGAKIGIAKNNLGASINYNRITKAGRYLMPREWGREAFFTFLPRERNEGLGDVNAFTLKMIYTLPKYNLKTNIGIGYFKLPSVTNYKFNKYSMPSYAQLNADIRYEFKGILEGFETQLLYVYKWNASKENIDPKNIFNKVNMSNVNLIINFHF